MPIFLSHTTATECWRSGRFDALLGGPSISKRHRPAGSIQVEDTASILAMDRLDVTYREALAFGSVREGEALACNRAHAKSGSCEQALSSLRPIRRIC